MNWRSLINRNTRNVNEIVKDCEESLRKIVYALRNEHELAAKSLNLSNEMIREKTEEGAQIHKQVEDEKNEVSEIEDAKHREMENAVALKEQERLVIERERRNNQLYHRLIEENNALNEEKRLIIRSSEITRITIFERLKRIKQNIIELSSLNPNPEMFLQRYQETTLLLDDVKKLLRQKQELTERRKQIVESLEQSEKKDEELVNENEYSIDKERKIGKIISFKARQNKKNQQTHKKELDGIDLRFKKSRLE